MWSTESMKQTEYKNVAELIILWDVIDRKDCMQRFGFLLFAEILCQSRC